MQHVLTQGGISSYLATHHDPAFTSLLDETKNLIRSSDFERVLGLGLDRVTEVLFDGLLKNVFVDPNSPLDESQDFLRLRLAGLLPGLARWSHLALNGLPNELVDVRDRLFALCKGIFDDDMQSLTGLREAAGFSAIIFSTFEDRYR
jgi:peroxin-3